jgi:hypothetical protein
MCLFHREQAVFEIRQPLFSVLKLGKIRDYTDIHYTAPKVNIAKLHHNNSNSSINFCKL